MGAHPGSGCEARRLRHLVSVSIRVTIRVTVRVRVRVRDRVIE